MKISFTDAAFCDMESIVDYYETQGVPHIGTKFVVEIIKHIDILNDHPNIGRVVPEFNVEHIREIIHSPFRVVYLRENKSIKIIRIWRSERLLKLSEET